MIGNITNKARYGTTTNVLPTSSTISDTTNIINLNMATSQGELNSASKPEDLAAYGTLSVIQTSVDSGVELIAYQYAQETGTNTYKLANSSNVVNNLRGVYGTTIQSHAIGSQFIRLDDAIFKWLVPSELIGETVYLKFCSTNVFGNFTQSLDDVDPYTVAIPTQNLPQPYNVTISTV